MTSRVNQVLQETVEHDDITFVHLVDLARQLEEELAASQAQVAELTKQAVSLANQTGRALSRAEAAEAQVAELKKAQPVVTRVYEMCPEHEGWAFTMDVTYSPPLVKVCPVCNRKPKTEETGDAAEEGK